MINVIDVNPVHSSVSWENFHSNVTELIATITDKERSVVMCRGVPAEWQENFEIMGRPDDIYVAWVRFSTDGDGEFFFAFIAWSEQVLKDFVAHVGEEIMGGEQTSFEKVAPPTLH